jgi:ferric iron reductase protein FhuF
VQLFKIVLMIESILVSTTSSKILIPDILALLKTNYDFHHKLVDLHVDYHHLIQPRAFYVSRQNQHIITDDIVLLFFNCLAN